MACMSVFAMAAPEDALLFTDPKDPSVITVMPVGDTLYILARQQNADTQLYEEVLYAYTLGASTAPELVCDDFCYTRNYLTLAQVPAEDSARLRMALATCSATAKISTASITSPAAWPGSPSPRAS